MKRVLVTGASGFVGGHLVAALKEHEHSIFPVSRKDIQDPFSTDNWQKLLEESEADTVVHLIAKTHSADSGDPSALSDYRHVNVDITAALLNAAKNRRIERFIYLSSIKAVGEGTTVDEPFTEDIPCRPEDCYGISKRETEELVLRSASDMDTTILRPPMIYGPGVKGNFLRLLKYAHRGYPLPIGNIRNSRSLIFVENLADAVINTIEGTDKICGIYHVADREPISTPQLYRELLKNFGRSTYLLPFPEGWLEKAIKLTGKEDNYRKIAGSLTVSSDKFRNFYGWKEPFTFDEGIKKTCLWYEAQQGQQSGKRSIR